MLLPQMLLSHHHMWYLLIRVLVSSLATVTRDDLWRYDNSSGGARSRWTSGRTWTARAPTCWTSSTPTPSASRTRSKTTCS